jgi:uncharacterized protein YycO
LDHFAPGNEGVKLRFVLGSDLASSAIALFSAGYFSHVDAIVPTASGLALLGSRNDEVGGKPAGVQIRPFGYAPVKRSLVLSVTATAEQETAWLKFLTAQIGKPYDKPAIWAFAFGRDWREPDSWFCSELQAAALESCGIVKSLVFPPNKVTPAELAQIVSALGATEESS